MTQQEKKWQEVVQNASQFADKLGRGLDPGITDTVIALNMLGIPTTQSCEGHLDHGRPYPWVMFGTEEVADLFRQSGAAYTREQYEEAHRLKRQAEAAQAHYQRKVLEALTAFYEHRHVPHDRRLIVYGRTIAGTSILESQGAMCLTGQPQEVGERKLAEYQDEMRAFTAFLKGTYFK
jgi:hypothetical protein